MKKLLVLILTLAASVAFAQANDAKPSSGAAVKPPASKAHILTRAEFDALLAKPERLLLIDVRRPDELTAKGGFPVYLSVQFGELEKSLAWIPKDRTVVTVSNHAGRAAKAADVLASKGFKVAGAVGSETYEQQGGTAVVRIAPNPQQATAANADGAKK